jgi:hypothetical protein
MSDAPPRRPKPATTSTPSAKPTRRWRFDLAVLPILVAGAVLLGALAWLLTRPALRPELALDPERVEMLERRTAELQEELQAARSTSSRLEERVGALEGVPERLQQLAALEPALRQLEGVPEQMRQLGALAERLRGLEARPLPPDLTPLREQAAANAARLASIEQRQANTEQGLRDLAARPVLDPAALAPVSGRIDRLADRAEAEARAAQERAADTTRRIEELTRAGSARDAALDQRLGAAEGALANRVTALEGALAARISALEAAQGRLVALEARAARLAALDATRTALEAGRPLGEALRNVPEPPAALARFATVAPPTEAALKLSFDEHTRAALAASEPSRDGQGVLDSAVARLSGLITVRRGEDLVWGDAAAAEIERARRALEAGDLPEALARLSRLPPAAQQAMRPWTEQAEALVAARAALRQMAAG